MRKVVIIVLLLACSTMAAKAWVHGLSLAPPTGACQTGFLFNNKCNTVLLPAAIVH
jgi:hypothetical protein